MSGRCMWYCARQGRQFSQAIDQQQPGWGWGYPGYSQEQVYPVTVPRQPYGPNTTQPMYSQNGWIQEFSSGYASPQSVYSSPVMYLPYQQQYQIPNQQQPSLLYEPQYNLQQQQQGWSNCTSPVGNSSPESHVGYEQELPATSHFNRWLTKRITEASTPKELLHLIQQKGRYFDKVHLAAGYVQAARLQQDKSVRTDTNSINEAVEQLCRKSTPEMLSMMDGWTLSNTMWGLVKTKFHTSALGKSVSKYLIAEVARKAETFKSQELSITAWSLARMKMRSETVLHEISRVALQRTHSLGAQAISNTLWAFASLNQYDPELFNALVHATADSFYEFDPQGLSNVLWALAQMGHYDEEFMAQVCDFLCGVKESSFNIFPVGLSQIVVALGRLNYKHDALLDRIISKVVQDFSKIDQQSLCNTFFYWALLEQDYDKLQTLAQEILTRYETGGVRAFKSADLQRICEGVQLFETQNLRVNFPEELMQHARRELRASYKDVTIPQKVKVMIAEIVDILGKLGENATPYKLVDNPIYEVPIGLEVDGKNIAIFSVGSRMYSSTRPFRKSGLMVAKQSLLQHYGWRIVDTPIHDWEQLGSNFEKENYLKQKINDALQYKKYKVVAGIEVHGIKGGL
eukprot:TRINITY_DN1988_c0_g1_i1.p1 TRINITY_DN1988_c0_g1~~TRINITY_DN1988_c0_g1_i1.p1  ORF type:complete len:629 (-),score=95.55 TRINITY_DN1988_c0_g1_i1:4678-6564(-)